MNKLYVRYYCSESCDYKLTLNKGLPRSKDGVFHPATYTCPLCDSPLCVKVNDGPFIEKTKLPKQ